MSCYRLRPKWGDMVADYRGHLIIAAELGTKLAKKREVPTTVRDLLKAYTPRLYELTDELGDEMGWPR